MATVCDMPDVPWNEMSFCSRHMHSEKNGLFCPPKIKYRPISESKIDNYSIYFNGFPWPYPQQRILEAMAKSD